MLSSATFLRFYQLNTSLALISSLILLAVVRASLQTGSSRCRMLTLACLYALVTALFINSHHLGIFLLPAQLLTWFISIRRSPQQSNSGKTRRLSFCLMVIIGMCCLVCALAYRWLDPQSLQRTQGYNAQTLSSAASIISLLTGCIPLSDWGHSMSWSSPSAADLIHMLCNLLILTASIYGAIFLCTRSAQNSFSLQPALPGERPLYSEQTLQLWLSSSPGR